MKVIQERIMRTKFDIYGFITFYTAIPYTNQNSVDRIGSTLFSLGEDKTYFVSHHSFLWYKWLP